MSKRILVVDDYPAMLGLLQTVLEEFADYSVRTASDGITAQTIIEEDQIFDLALLDINLPGKLSGLQLAPIVRRTSPACAIVYVSGQDLPAKLVDRGAPYIGYLKKPFHIRDLLGEVKRALTAAEPSSPSTPERDELYTVVPLLRSFPKRLRGMKIT